MLDIGKCVKTIQTIALEKRAKILKRVLQIKET